MSVALTNAAHAESFKMAVQESEDLRLLYFDPTQTYLTPHVTRVFYNALAFQEETFGWTPWDETTLLLKDFSDYGNGAAFSSPSNSIHLDIAPVSRTFESFVASERIYSLLNHELVHVAALDDWNDRDAFWRRVFFGKPMPEDDHPITILYNFLATPRVNAPRWYHEGSAVFLETWMAGGLGRAQGAYDEMVFRSMVRDGADFYGPLGLVSEGIAADFRGLANAYLYGNRFFSYLALQYSPEQVIEWLARGEDSKAYYSRQFKHVFGKPLTEVWREWIAFENAFQMYNLERVNAYPVTETQALASQGLGSVSRAFHVKSRNGLIAAFRYPGEIEYIGELDLDDGSMRKFADIKGSMPHRVASVAYDKNRDRIWYTTDNRAYRDLIEIDVASGNRKRRLTDARIGDIVFDPTTEVLWGVRHLNGYSSLVKIPPPYDKWEQVFTARFGEDMFDTEISADGSMLAMIVGAVGGAQTLKVFRTADLGPDGADPVAFYTPGSAVPESPAFSQDGRYVYFSSYYTGVSNIFRLDVETGDVEALTNAETGFFRPIPLDDGGFIVFEYKGDGFTPARIDGAPLEDVSAIKFLGAEIAAKHPIIRDWSVGSPMKVDLDEIAPKTSDYRPRRRLRLDSIYPVIEGFRGTVAPGIHINIDDPAHFNQIDITLSYSPGGDIVGSERLHADVRYRGIHWRARYWHNDADFYDLFGPTKRARAGDAFIIGYERALIYDDPRELRVSAEAAYYFGLDTLPGNQNVDIVTFSDIFAFNTELNYTNTQSSLGAVDHEKGWRWRIENAVNRAGGDTVTRTSGGVDVGRPLPIKNSSVWLYTAGGVATGNSLNPLAQFYFGGFKNNYVDDRTVKRYRQYDTLPGFEIDEVAGRSFAKALVEWNLPPLRFEAVGAPSLYLANARTAVFAGGLFTNPGAADDRQVYTAGVQIDLNFTIAHRLPMTLSAGYASGFESGFDRRDEFLISLKIM